MTDALFLKPPKRMKQPTKDTIRNELELARAQKVALEIYVDRMHMPGAHRALEAIQGFATPRIASSRFSLHRLLGL